MGAICMKPKPPTPEPSPIPPKPPTPDDLEMSSDFVEFVIQMEGDSDEVKLPSIEEDYPTAKPVSKPKKSAVKISWFSDWHADDENGSSDDADENTDEMISQGKLDEHARGTPRTVLSGYDKLIEYLEKHIKGNRLRDELLVRALLVWLSSQEIESFQSENGTIETPLGYLSLLGQKRSTYSSFFTLLCRKANIACVQIHGVCKAGDYQPGDQNMRDLGCFWNAVNVDNCWQIVHPFWVCRSVFGKQAGGWIKLEESGKTVAKRQKESSGILRNAFQEYYIMPAPQQFVYRCHPDDTKWQLLSSPIERKQFINQAYILPPFWGLGFKLLSENACNLTVDGGSAKISFALPKKSANSINVDYEFLLKEGGPKREDETRMLQAENIPKLVSKIRNGSMWDFYIQCPVEGIYKIVIYAGPENKPLLRICEFKITCNIRTENCKLSPINPGMIGFGPGQKTEHVGLLLPSHRNGLLKAETLKPTKLSFLLDSVKSKSLSVQTKLFGSDSTEESNQVICEIVKKRELKITMTLKRDGDYALSILAGSDEESMDVACNYLVTTTTKFAYEKANQRNARNKLLSYIESAGIKEIEELKLSISKCTKEKISANDSDIENAQRKLEVLQHRKDIRDAYMRCHHQTTLNTIKSLEESPYARIFADRIVTMKEFADHLESLHGFTQQMPNIREAVGDLAHTKSDVVKNLIVALAVLMGNSASNSMDEQELIILTKEVVPKLTNVEKIKSSMKPENAKKALAIIKRYSFVETRNANAMAAQIYDLVTKISEALTKPVPGEDDM